MNYMTKFEFNDEFILEQDGILNVPKETIINIHSINYRIIGFGLFTSTDDFIIYLEEA